MRWIAMLVFVTFISGCNQAGNKPGDDKNNKDDQQQAKNEGDELEKELGAQKPVDPVPFAKLMPLLPKAPAGYEAEEPKGFDLSHEQFKYSAVEGTYRKGDRTLQVHIQDGAHVRGLYDAILAGRKLSFTSTEGHTKSVTLEGHPGFESYQKANQRTELWIVVARRHIVHITTEGEPADFATTVFKSIDVKKLASLK
jgi:hypothetical protein